MKKLTSTLLLMLFGLASVIAIGLFMRWAFTNIWLNVLAP